MPMPKTAMYEYDGLEFGEDDVRLAWQVLAVQPESHARGVQEARTAISGFVFFPLIEDIIRLLVALSTMSATALPHECPVSVQCICHGLRDGRDYRYRHGVSELSIRLGV